MSKEQTNTESLNFLQLDFEQVAAIGKEDNYEEMAKESKDINFMCDALFSIFDNNENDSLIALKAAYYMTVFRLYSWVDRYVDGLNPDVLDDPNVISQHETRLRALTAKAELDANARIGKTGDDEKTANFIYVRDAFMVANELGLIA